MSGTDSSEENSKVMYFFVDSKKHKQRNTNVPNMKEIQSLFVCPQDEAAKALNLSETKLRKICRENGIGKWPYRHVYCFC